MQGRNSCSPIARQTRSKGCKHEETNLSKLMGKDTKRLAVASSPALLARAARKGGLILSLKVQTNLFLEKQRNKLEFKSLDNAMCDARCAISLSLLARQLVKKVRMSFFSSSNGKGRGVPFCVCLLFIVLTECLE